MRQGHAEKLIPALDKTIQALVELSSIGADIGSAGMPQDLATGIAIGNNLQQLYRNYANRLRNFEFTEPKIKS